jgi:murein L,D-transpeptidase YcbB/YkuD
MIKRTNSGLKCLLALLLVLLFAACHNRGGSSGKSAPEKPKEKDIVEEPEALDVRIGRNINEALEFVLVNKGVLNDSMVLTQDSLLNTLYQKRNYEPVWCSQEKWSPLSDSLVSFMAHATNYGLFPSDYHYRLLNNIRQLTLFDSLGQKDAALWSRGDMLLSDAFFRLCYDLRKGRLPYDSLTLRKDSMGAAGYLGLFEQFRQTGNITELMQGLEPKHPGYDSLKVALQALLQSMDTLRQSTHIIYPGQDSATLYNKLRQRLFEEGIVRSAVENLDTAGFRAAIRRFQESKGLPVTGKLNENTVAKLNNTPWERFIRVAITLDRYKQLPDSLPTTYIWVNIPAFTMRIVDSGNVVLESKVIVGQPKTRTPELYSNVSNFITYPQWTVPYSIIFNEMLPKIKQSTDYLRRQNLIVVDDNDIVINPDSINWKKLSRDRFPYLIKQRQGDDNSLGVLKFNFVNKYSVYLHDTNARWLFSKDNRALSHGCVRIKEFMKLADFLVRNDTIRFHPDTLRSWIARREKHVVSGFKRVPIFIRYFTCEAKEGKIKFYDDIYGEDKLLSERYFANKSL